MGYDKAAVRCCSSPGSASSSTGSRSRCRSGPAIHLLDQLLAEIGPDAARWYFGSRGPTTESTSTSSWPEAVSREPRPLRPVRPRPDRLSRKAARPGSGRRHLAVTSPGPRPPSPVSSSAAGRRRMPRRPKTGVTAFAADLATSFRFYRDARVVDRRSGAISGPPRPRRRHSDHAPLRSACSGSRRPTLCNDAAGAPQTNAGGEADRGGRWCVRILSRRSPGRSPGGRGRCRRSRR